MKNIYQNLLKQVPDKTRRFVRHSVDIGNLILDTLKTKDLSIQDYAKQINEAESDIIKWATGTFNFDLKTIALIETSLSIEIIKRF